MIVAKFSTASDLSECSSQLLSVGFRNGFDNNSITNQQSVDSLFVLYLNAKLCTKYQIEISEMDRENNFMTVYCVLFDFVLRVVLDVGYYSSTYYLL